MYTKAAEHTVRIPLVDSLCVALGTAPTITISKDGAAFAAVENTPEANGSTWNLVITETEADCDGYVLYITHDDLPMPVFYADEAGTAHGVNIVEVGNQPVELIEDSFLDAAGAREALGMTNADLDTQLSGLGTAIDGIEVGLDAEAVRSALGMTNANLDDQLAGLDSAIGEIEAGSGGDATAENQEAILAAVNALDVGTGTGANAVTITIDDGTDPLESVKVRVTKGAESYLGTTNASGVATFALDNGTWTVRATLPLYTMDAETLVVDGDEDETYSMSAVSITPSEPGSVTGYWIARCADGQPIEGVEIGVRVKSSMSAGTAHQAATRTVVSDEAGVASVANLLPSVRYEARAGQGPWIEFIVPAGSASPYQLPDIWGIWAV